MNTSTAKLLLEWSSDFLLGEAATDDTHREFVDLLNRVGAASDNDLPGALDDFIAHTEAHFGQEDRWMQTIAFPPLHCHQGEHANVLEVVREVRKRVTDGQPHLGAVLAKAIAEWFPQHAATMDAMLAAYMKQTGYVPGTQPASVSAVAATDATAATIKAGCAAFSKAG